MLVPCNKLKSPNDVMDWRLHASSWRDGQDEMRNDAMGRMGDYI